MSSSVSVIVPNWNSEKYIRECLESLFAQTYRDFEVLVVDDASTDNSVNIIKQNYPQVRVIQNKRNLGFAATVNVGIRNTQSQYIAIFPIDVRAEPAWLSELLRIVELDERIGSVACKVLLYHYPQFIDSVGSLLLNNGRIDKRGHFEQQSQYNDETEVFGSGAIALYSRKIFEELGCFDEDFFMYVEDSELDWRLRLAGWRSVYAPKAVAYHRVSVSAKDHPDFQHHAFYLIHRNVTFILLKDIPLAFILRNLPWIALTTLLAIVASAIKGTLFMYLKAKIDAFCKLEKMLKKRWSIRKHISSIELNKWCQNFITFNIFRYLRYRKVANKE